jgi:hypothetical protein
VLVVATLAPLPGARPVAIAAMPSPARSPVSLPPHGWLARTFAAPAADGPAALASPSIDRFEPWIESISAG